MNPYQDIDEGYEGQSEVEEVLSPSSESKVDSRNVTKSEETPRKIKNTDSVLGDSVMVMQHSPPSRLVESDIVSGFEEGGSLPPIRGNKNWNVADIE